MANRDMRYTEARLFHDLNKVERALYELRGVRDPCPRMKDAIENLESLKTFYKSELRIIHGEKDV